MDNTRDAFLRTLDAAIINGLSSAQVARKVGVNEVTVRRRKAALAREGHSFNRKTLGIVPEANNATNNR